MKYTTAACVSLLALTAPVAAQGERKVFGDLAVETFASGLDHPWGLAFLPDGRPLVTERPGRQIGNQLERRLAGLDTIEDLDDPGFQ